MRETMKSLRAKITELEEKVYLLEQGKYVRTVYVDNPELIETVRVLQCKLAGVAQ